MEFYHGGFYFSTLSNATAYSILPISDGGLNDFLIQKRRSAKTGLWTFTARQVQENVLSQHKSLAIASLLLETGVVPDDIFEDSW